MLTWNCQQPVSCRLNLSSRPSQSPWPLSNALFNNKNNWISLRFLSPLVSLCNGACWSDGRSSFNCFVISIHWHGHWRNLWCLCLHETFLIFKQRKLIVLLYFCPEKSFNCVDHNSAGFSFSFLSTLKVYVRCADPWREFSLKRKQSTVLMIHTFSMWPTLRNTIYFLQITSLGHPHICSGFSRTKTSARILCIVDVFYTLSTIWYGKFVLLSVIRAWLCSW